MQLGFANRALVTASHLANIEGAPIQYEIGSGRNWQSAYKLTRRYLKFVGSENPLGIKHGKTLPLGLAATIAKSHVNRRTSALNLSLDFGKETCQLVAIHLAGLLQLQFLDQGGQLGYRRFFEKLA